MDEAFGVLGIGFRVKCSKFRAKRRKILRFCGFWFWDLGFGV